MGLDRESTTADGNGEVYESFGTVRSAGDWQSNAQCIRRWGRTVELVNCAIERNMEIGFHPLQCEVNSVAPASLEKL
jgi:hypothetical protein